MAYVLESKQCFVICGKILVNWGIVSSEVFTFFSESLLLHIFIDESAYYSNEPLPANFFILLTGKSLLEALIFASMCVGQ